MSNNFPKLNIYFIRYYIFYKNLHFEDQACTNNPMTCLNKQKYMYIYWQIQHTHMKRSAIILGLLLFTITTKAATTATDASPIDTAAINSAIKAIESHLELYNNNIENYSTEIAYDGSRESAKSEWELFVQQCKRNEYKNAYDTYRAGAGTIKIYINNSAARYRFLSEVLLPLMQKYENPDDLDHYYFHEIQSEFYLQTATLVKSEFEEPPHIPGNYHKTIIAYGRVLNLMGRHEEALNLIPLLSDIVNEFYAGVEISEAYMREVYKAYLSYDLGKAQSAIKIFAKLKSAWSGNKDDKYHAYVLAEIDALIDSFKQNKSDSHSKYEPFREVTNVYGFASQHPEYYESTNE